MPPHPPSSGSAVATTTRFFRKLVFPVSNQPPVTGSAATNTDVSRQDAVLLHKFRVVDWDNFNAEASKVLAGTHAEKELSPRVYETVESNLASWSSRRIVPKTEGALVSAFENNVINVVEKLKQELDLQRNYEWRTAPGNVLTRGYGQRPAAPDLALSAVSHPDKDPRTAGEAKRKHVQLAHVDPSWLTQKLASVDSSSPLENNLRPFLQMFAYALRSTRGLGILTNYDQTRFFRIDLSRQRIYMSPMIPINQVLYQSTTNPKPHLLQALLCFGDLHISADKFNDNRKTLVEDTAFRKIYGFKPPPPGNDRHDKGSSSKGTGSSSKRPGSSSKTGSKHTTAVYCDDGRNEIRLCPEPEHDWEVTRVLANCEMIGELGSGLTGPVTEREYKGTRVAVKAGFPFHTMKNNEEDTYSHVLNEVEIYMLLQDVQGDVVPRVIVGGHDIMFFPGCMILITEKVGVAIEQKNGALFVNGYQLGSIELKAARDKALSALDKIHACGVVHNDPRIANLRLGMKDGKVDRVWWIDFGLAWAHGHPTYGAVDFLRYDSDHKRITMAFDEFLRQY